MQQFSKINKYNKKFTFKGCFYKVKPRFEKIVSFASPEHLKNSRNRNESNIALILNSQYETVSIGQTKYRFTTLTDM